MKKVLFAIPNSFMHPWWLALLCSGLLSAGTACAAETAASAEQTINMLHQQAETLTQKAEMQYRHDQRGCYHQFLVNHCLDGANEKRLATIAQAHALKKKAMQINLRQKKQAYIQRFGAFPEPDLMREIPAPIAVPEVAPRSSEF